MGKIKPLTSVQLKKIFSSKRFTSRLDRSEEITRETGHEVGFNIYRFLYDSRYIYTPIPESDQGDYNPFESFPGPFSEEDLDLLEETGYDPYDSKVSLVLGFHTHSLRGICSPSHADLRSNLNSRLRTYEGLELSYNTFPLLVIAHIGMIRDHLDILVVQDVNDKPSKASIKMAYERASQEWANRDPDVGLVAATYDALPNFKATSLRYRKTRLGYRLSDDELSKLERFTLTPILLPQEK